jgi:hypothetical protein
MVDDDTHPLPLPKKVLKYKVLPFWIQGVPSSLDVPVLRAAAEFF